jgi:NAD-dependent deacetylase
MSEIPAETRHWLAAARSVAVLTGAGISAESGIPTFRGSGGLWREFRAEDLATPQAFANDPALVWQWYDWRRGVIARAQPNAAHLALAGMETRYSQFSLITQNVDGLHDRAGSRNILKIHGDIWTLRCTGCGRGRQDRRAPLPEIPPRCLCGALERPGVVWFGESLPEEPWQKAEQAAQSAEIFLVIGTSAAVYPAAGLVGLAKAGGARVIEINVEKTPATDLADLSLLGPAAEILPGLAA